MEGLPETGVMLNGVVLDQVMQREPGRVGYRDSVQGLLEKEVGQVAVHVDGVFQGVDGCVPVNVSPVVRQVPVVGQSVK